MHLTSSAVPGPGIWAAILAAVAFGPAAAGTLCGATAALAAPARTDAPAARIAAARPAEAVQPAGVPEASASPGSAQPGQPVTFDITCSAGATSATLFGATLGLPEQIPMDTGARAGQFTATVTLPHGIAPGTYSPSADCDNGQSAPALLTIAALPSQGAQTGDGTTSTALDGTVTAGGLTLLGLGAVIGGFALRQRRSARRG
jgi:hypothetical protein